MHRSPLGAGVHVVETRSGRYRVALIPLPASAIPGFRASAVQAVRSDTPGRAIRLTLFERELPFPAPDDLDAA
ncbi:MAG: hypothetical protein C4558_07190 [Dehalococcoidia bacterium]|nr:MAG: hypothetical protein C4558_07190 [Dehalococcoidia bacterium]